MKLKKADIFVVVITMIFSCSANAVLIPRLGGQAYYDTVLDITWLADANYAKTSGYDADGMLSWSEAVDWAAQLEFGGFQDWRLPEANPINGISYNYTWAVDGTSDWGYNITSPYSELAYMFYVNLGNTAFVNPDSTTNSVFGLDNTGVFSNLQENNYWTQSFYEPPFRTNSAFLFLMATGEQHVHGIPDQFYAWAVRDGDVSAVPTPAAIWLFASGLIGLFGFCRKNSK